MARVGPVGIFARRERSVEENVESGDERQVTMQLVISKKNVPHVFEEVYRGIASAHPGVKNTLELVRKRFYWVQCRKDVEKMVQKVHSLLHSRRAPLHGPKGK